MSQRTASAVFLLVATIPTSHQSRTTDGHGFLDSPFRRFAGVFAAAFVVIGAGQLLKGHTAWHSATQGLVWAAVSASIFVAARLYQSRKGRHCALCRDTPEMGDTPQG